MRRLIAILAALAVLVVPASALATPYLALTEAWLAAKVAVERRYDKHVSWSVGNINSPRTDCHRNSSTAVDCGYQVVFPAEPGQIRACSGTARLRMTRRYRIISTMTPQPACRLVTLRG
jgi:hypothetical protein